MPHKAMRCGSETLWGIGHEYLLKRAITIKILNIYTWPSSLFKTKINL
jgi:hypothetical protein